MSLEAEEFMENGDMREKRIYGSMRYAHHEEDEQQQKIHKAWNKQVQKKRNPSIALRQQFREG